MGTEKEYRFNQHKLVLQYISVCALVLITSVFVFKLIDSPVILLLVTITPTFFLYLQYREIAIIRQFNRIDNSKRVIFNADRSTMSLVQGNKSITISDSDILRVEIYEQENYGNLIVSQFSYVVIYTYDNKRILITNFTIPLSIYDKSFEKFLRKKPRTYFKRTFNYINEDLLADNSI